MVSGRAHPALDHRLCRIDHDGGPPHAWHRRCPHHRRAAPRLYLRHHGGVRLACSGDGGSRSCGCHFRISSTLPAREATAHPRVLNSIFNSTTQSDHLRRTNMEVILLERVAKLGQMGEVVRVKDGFARNFLLKRSNALRATADNRARFDGMKAELEARNFKAKAEATTDAENNDGL